MSGKIEKIKADFVNAAKKFKIADHLDAIFTIGSVSNAHITIKDYQDFDIHFLFPEIRITQEELSRIKMVFEFIREKYTTTTTAIEFAVTDLPWKMKPQKIQNIGLHGTIMNKLDFVRRAEFNHILARNMWDNGEILYGDLDYRQRDLTQSDFAESPGGTGWIKEQFYRFLAAVNLNDMEALAPINDACYYFGLSPLLHYYYINHGRTESRAVCLEYLMLSDVPKEIKRMVREIKISKHTKFFDKRGYEQLLDATITVINYFHHICANPQPNEQKPSFVSDCNSGKISNASLLGKEISITENHFIVEDGNFEHLKKQMNEQLSTLKNPRVYDFFSAIKEAVSGTGHISRVYFWTGDNLQRLKSLDFQTNEVAELFAWETGITTLIQRLHEMPINNHKDTQIAKAISEISTASHSESYYKNLENLYHKADELSGNITTSTSTAQGKERAM